MRAGRDPGWQHAGALRAAAAVSAANGLGGEFVAEPVSESMWRVLEHPQRCHDWLHGGGACRTDAAAPSGNTPAPCETKDPLRVWSCRAR